jgi:hypothetical protein
MKKHPNNHLYYFLTLKKGNLNYKNSKDNTFSIINIKDQNLRQNP